MESGRRTLPARPPAGRRPSWTPRSQAFEAQLLQHARRGRARRPAGPPARAAPTARRSPRRSSTSCRTPTSTPGRDKRIAVRARGDRADRSQISVSRQRPRHPAAASRSASSRSSTGRAIRSQRTIEGTGPRPLDGEAHRERPRRQGRRASDVGHGATFTIALPAAVTVAAAERARRAAGEGGRRGREDPDHRGRPLDPPRAPAQPRHGGLPRALGDRRRDRARARADASSPTSSSWTSCCRGSAGSRSSARSATDDPDLPDPHPLREGAGGGQGRRPPARRRRLHGEAVRR